MSKKKHTIKDAKMIGKKVECTLLSKEYINCSSKLKWQCNVCDTIFYASYNKVRDGQSCPKCTKERKAEINRKYNIFDLKKYAINNNGLCLSTEYTNCDTKYTWYCNKHNYVWKNSWYKVGKKDQWCYHCGLEKIGEYKSKYSIIDLQKFAELKKSKCLSTEYLGYHKNHLWQCSNGHKW